jgi:hypothetical protein
MTTPFPRAVIANRARRVIGASGIARHWSIAGSNVAP